MELVDIEEMLKDIPLPVKIGMYRQKIEAWKNTIFLAQLDAQVAKVSGNKQLAQQAENHISEGIKAIMMLGDKMKELEGE
jgi:hypothetical protein